MSLNYALQASFGNSVECSEMWRRVVCTYLAKFRRILLSSPSDTLRTETTTAWQQRVLQNWRIKAKEIDRHEGGSYRRLRYTDDDDDDEDHGSDNGWNSRLRFSQPSEIQTSGK